MTFTLDFTVLRGCPYLDQLGTSHSRTMLVFPLRMSFLASSASLEFLAMP